jgi:dTDP-glucose pyrophosphorylase
MKKKTLLILAAGMGSRYGGLKQLDEVGPNGETIIDYSVYDALQAGFNKLVFIIRDEFKSDMQDKVCSKFDKHFEIHYVNQAIDSPIGGIRISSERTKPWGTGHAVLVAENVIDEPFAVINADDFYGRDGFLNMASFLEKDCNEKTHGLIGYILKNTLSENGHVSRGVCSVNSDMTLASVKERTKIQPMGDSVFFEQDNQKVEVDPESIVSMNFWGFHPSIFSELRRGFLEFAKNSENHSGSEYFIPLAVDHCIQSGQAEFKTIISQDKWYGVTYREDKADVQEALQQMAIRGIYPNPLFK